MTTTPETITYRNHHITTRPSKDEAGFPNWLAHNYSLHDFAVATGATQEEAQKKCKEKLDSLLDKR